MPEKVLLVDDDLNLLSACRRQYRRRFELVTAEGGAQGLAALAEQGPFAVIVSDMRMPHMDGVELLAKAREVSPSTTRIMLTGNSDLVTAVKAVNQGCIFRFLNKPCEADDLATAIEAGIEHHRLLRLEKDLLERTLKGSVSVLADVLALAKPLAFGRATRARRIAGAVAARVKMEHHWQMELAAMLSQVGCISIAEDLLERAFAFQPLSPDDHQTFLTHARIGSELVGRIPRLESVAEIILHQECHFDGSDATGLRVAGEAIPMGARILKPALDYDALRNSGVPAAEALSVMQARTGLYDPDVLTVFHSVFADEALYKIKRIPSSQIYPGAMLAQDLKTTDGLLLLAKGQEITTSLCVCLKNLVQRSSVVPEWILVQCPEGA